MRIVIDMQGAQSESRFRGIGRYSLSLALAIARNAAEHEIFLVLNASFPKSILDIRHAFKDLIKEEHIRIFEIPLSVAESNKNNETRARIAELIREYFLEQLNPDYILITSLFEGYVDNTVTSIGAFSSKYNTATILYDLIPYLDQKTYLPVQHQHDYYMRKIESLKKSNLLLSISESAKNEGIQILGIKSKQIQNISTAVDNNFQPLKLSVTSIKVLHKKYNISSKMIMYAPGGFDARKNFEGIIQAFSLLSPKVKKVHQLVIVSKIQERDKQYLNALAKQYQLNNNELIITGYIPDEDLIKLYNTATLFVFPSKHEGFGLPVLEAMACGTPVIGSNTTSIPEVIGWEEALFNPNLPQEIATLMEKSLTNNFFRDKLIKNSYNQKQKFSWDKSAISALQAIEESYIKIKDIPNKNIVNQISNLLTATNYSDKDLIKISKAISFNTINNKKQILIDISEIVKRDAKSGIQRVVRSILFEFLNGFHINDYTINGIYFDGNQYRYANTFILKFLNKKTIKITDEIVKFKQNDIYLALDLNAHLVDTIHSYHSYLQSIGVKLYFIVYDILLVQHSEWWPKGTSNIFEKWLKSITEVSTGLICISESVAEDVKKWMTDNPPHRVLLPKVTSFHLGADVENSLPSTGLLDNTETVISQLNSKPSFLMVGTIEPRKAHVQTLEAFEELWQKGIDINLVIVGKEGWLIDPLIKKLKNHPELNKRLFWLEGISDEYLEKVYASSTCLIAASEGEGFGLPLIEAAQHKIPIIARDIPVFKEVSGKHAYYFENTKEPKALVDTIKNWLQLHQQNKHPKSNNMPWLTWKESTAQLLTCLNIQGDKK